MPIVSGRQKVTVTLEAKDVVSAVLKKLRGAFSGFSKATASRFKKLNKTFKSVKLGLGSITTGLIGAGGLTFALKKALEAAVDFEKGLAEIKTLGVEKSLAEIGDEVDALSRSFGQKPQAVIRAYYDAISAGVKEANVAKFLREASTLALAGATDISTATDLLTTLRSVYGDLTDNELAAFANATKNLGKTTIPELAANLGQIAPTAAAIGLSMAELSAAMAVSSVSLSDTGLAATGLRSFLSQILKPTDETQKLAKKLGVEFSITALKTKGLSGFLEELIPKIEGNDEAIVTLFGDVRAFGVAAVLAKDGGAVFEEALAGIRTEVETGALEKAAELMKDTASVRLGILQAELDSIVRTLTLEMLPGISAFAKGISDIIALKTGRVFEREFAEPIKKTGAAVRRLQEQLENTAPFVKVGSRRKACG
jgi:TP901 family phage tail tape measure protein